MSEALRVAQALRGIRSGEGFLVQCPVPSHGRGQGDKHPSLSVRDGAQRLLLTCHAGCHPLDILDALRAKGLLDDRPPEREAVPPPRAAIVRPDAEAVSLWSVASPIKDTLAHRYLVARGIRALSPALRFLPPGGYLSGHLRHPAMVAAVQRFDGTVIAVQVTALAPDGSRKAAIDVPRRSMGALADGAVCLGAPETALGLAEGTETALAAMQLTGVPCWASLGAGRAHRVSIPAGVRELHIFADNDAPGRSMAERVAAAHPHLARRKRFPPAGYGDWADVAKHEMVLA